MVAPPSVRRNVSCSSSVIKAPARKGSKELREFIGYTEIRGMADKDRQTHTEIDRCRQRHTDKYRQRQTDIDRQTRQDPKIEENKKSHN